MIMGCTICSLACDDDVGGRSKMLVRRRRMSENGRECWGTKGRGDERGRRACLMVGAAIGAVERN